MQLIKPALWRWLRMWLLAGATRMVGLLLVLALSAIQIWDPPLVEAARLRVFDQLQRFAPRPVPATSPVVVVDIDDVSLSRVGQWPWPRQTFAELITRLAEQGARTITFDILFAEADRLSPPIYARILEPVSPQTAAVLRTLPSFEQTMATAMRQRPVILGEAGLNAQPTGIARNVVPPARVAWLGPEVRHHLSTYAYPLAPVGILARAATGIGLVSITPEIDGVVRRAPTVAVVGEHVVPGLALETVRVALDETTLRVRGGDHGVLGVGVGPLAVPTEADGRIWVHYTRARPELYVPAHAVLAGAVDDARIAGKLVFIGSSAAGLGDIKVTPVAGNTAGVEIQAQLVENILAGTMLQRSQTIVGSERVLVLVGGLLLVWFGTRIPAGWFPPLLLLVLVLGIAAAWFAYTPGRMLIDTAYPAFAFGLLLFWLAMAKYITEEGRRRNLRHAFAHYLSPVMVDRLIDTPTALALEGDRRTLTVMFSDIRSFTTLTETLAEDPVGLTELLNRYFTAMTAEILEQQGTIDKYIGDAIMAFWNAPLDDPDHSRHACAAVLGMRRRLVTLNAELAAEAAAAGETFVPLRTGFGIQTGEAFVGNLGSAQRFNYSVIGDAVNVAARLETSSKSYGFPVIVGEAVREACPGMAFLALDEAMLKGKTEASRIYALVGDETLVANPSWTALQTAHEALLQALDGGLPTVAALAERCQSLAGELALDVAYPVLVATRVNPAVARSVDGGRSMAG